MQSSIVPNPNEVVYVPINLAHCLQSIQKSLADLHAKMATDIPEQEDWIESEEAAKMLHMSMDRFYTIHKSIFTSSKPGKKLLFSRKEVKGYIESKRTKPVSAAIQDAEDFRIKKLRRA